MEAKLDYLPFRVSLMSTQICPPAWPQQDSSGPAWIEKERDSCGVGFLAQLNRQPSHWLLQQALQALSLMEHRGGCCGDQQSGDGAGILCAVPWSLLAAQWPAVAALPAGEIPALGMVFLPPDTDRHMQARRICEEEAARLGLHNHGWRPVPVNASVLGPMAATNCPSIQQWLLSAATDQETLERLLFRCRRRIGERLRQLWPPDVIRYFSFASLSSRTVVYKGMVQSSVLADFYSDLRDERFTIPYAVYHRRFSTNTLPRWPLAQPMRMLAHNGEINTLLGNLNWALASQETLDDVWGEAADDLKPIVNPAYSDSANLDAMLELMVRSGRPIVDSLMTLVPEAFQHQPALKGRQRLRDFYAYSAGLQEAWDGPALLAFSDGRWIGACLDRNGLRPARYCVTDGGLVVMGSETGVVDIDQADVIEKGRLGPGQMLAVDLEAGRLLRNWEIKQEVANRYPYGQWLQQRCELEPQPWLGDKQLADLKLLQLQTAYGFTAEDLDLVMGDMAGKGKEPTYCMGDDIPLAVLSNKPHVLYDYFKQRFAQVTNPPIDPLREKLVMSLGMHLGARGSALSPHATGTHQVHLQSPLLNEAELNQLDSDCTGVDCRRLATLFPISAGPAGLKAAVERLCEEAEQAVRSGVRILVLSDREAGGISPLSSYIPPLLATGAVHHHLIRAGLRLRASLVIDTGQCWSTHHLACLVGYGASAVCPWLTWETSRHWLQHPKTRKLMERGSLPVMDADQVQSNVRGALEGGLCKILSKMGISLLASYHGAQIFEAIGIGADLIETAFRGTTSRVAGLCFPELASETLAFHSKAYPELNRSKLEFMGFVQYRTGGEYHLNSPDMAKVLHKAVAQGSAYNHFSTYRQLLEQRPPTTLRDLLEFRLAETPTPLDEVESVTEICSRFCTGGMSLGALSREAHEVLAVALNRIGGKSNSGEGGEDSIRFRVLDDVDEAGNSRRFPHLRGLRNGDTACSAIKQIASGRFGVTPEYLRSARQLEIKVAQGAKPGEGGQLPGTKVDPYIAGLRNSKPGVPLISPPPHHDIYSIEDLAQLIHDLHQIHPTAKVSVKLVAEVGIGTVAAGVAKANADVIQISGHDGGTGASPLSSIKHAGTPWEMGVIEVHRSLLDNGLRERVLLRADGGLKTGWDVVIAALLGAEEFGFGSVAMIAEGCIMARICHTNNCPVGVATQKQALRQRFTGLPEHVVNFFVFVAEEVRQLLSLMGLRRMDELTGRTDRLQVRPVTLAKTTGVDLRSLLAPIENDGDRSWLQHAPTAHDNGAVLLDNLLADPRLQSTVANHGLMTVDLPIRNTDRSVGARLAGLIAEQHGNKGFSGHLRLNFEGAAGQSFGAFCLQGMDMHLTGEANDYVGKGMNGGRIVVVPPRRLQGSASQHVILGNTCLYGATGGTLFVHGRAGERFAVRNSGASAVVEGTGDHCCEYMTGGVIVVLGPTGRNVAAGMTGGVVYLLRDDLLSEEQINAETIDLYRVDTAAMDRQLKTLLQAYAKATTSPKATAILADWVNNRSRFMALVPPGEKAELGLVPSSVLSAT